MPEPNLGLDLNIELLLNVLLDTTKVYMEAFSISTDSIDITLEMLKKYQAFEQVTAYYMDSKDECVSYATFSFDWNKYELIYNTDDPDVILSRKSIISQTPKQILADASNIIKARVSEIKTERDVKYIKMVYSYTDKVWRNKTLLEKIRKEAGLTPLEKKIEFSPKIKGIDTKIVSSLTEKTLSINYTV